MSNTPTPASTNLPIYEWDSDAAVKFEVAKEILAEQWGTLCRERRAEKDAAEPSQETLSALNKDIDETTELLNSLTPFDTEKIAMILEQAKSQRK